MKKLLHRYREHLKRRHARQPHEAWSTEWTLALAIILMGAGIVAYMGGTAPRVVQAPASDSVIAQPSQPTKTSLPLTTLAQEALALGRAPLPLTQGPEFYSITNKSPGPKVTRVDFDTFDPKLGEMQAVTVKANHIERIGRVTVELMTDHNAVVYDLDRTSGTELDGVWSTQILTEDTHELSYRMRIRAESTDPTVITLIFR